MKTHILKISAILISLSLAPIAVGQKRAKEGEKKEKNYFSYEYEKEIDESLKKYSKIKMDKITQLQKKFIQDLVEKNFAEQRGIRAEQRALYLELWKSGEAILTEEWNRFEKETAELESKITPDDIEKNVEIFNQINMRRGESNARIKSRLFDKLHSINENGGKLQLERNIQLKEKIREVLTEK